MSIQVWHCECHITCSENVKLLGVNDGFIYYMVLGFILGTIGTIKDVIRNVTLPGVSDGFIWLLSW